MTLFYSIGVGSTLADTIAIAWTASAFNPLIYIAEYSWTGATPVLDTGATTSSGPSGCGPFSIPYTTALAHELAILGAVAVSNIDRLGINGLGSPTQTQRAGTSGVSPYAFGDALDTGIAGSKTATVGFVDLICGCNSGTVEIAVFAFKQAASANTFMMAITGQTTMDGTFDCTRSLACVVAGAAYLTDVLSVARRLNLSVEGQATIDATVQVLRQWVDAIQGSSDVSDTLKVARALTAVMLGTSDLNEVFDVARALMMSVEGQAFLTMNFNFSVVFALAVLGEAALTGNFGVERSFADSIVGQATMDDAMAVTRGFDLQVEAQAFIAEQMVIARAFGMEVSAECLLTAYLNSGHAGVGFSLGADSAASGKVTLYANGGYTAPGANNFTLSIEDAITVLNATTSTSNLQLRVDNTPVIDMTKTVLALGEGPTQTLVFYQGIGTSTTYPNTFQTTQSAGTVLTLADRQPGIGIWSYQNDGGSDPQGLVFLGTPSVQGGALSTMGPNGIGHISSQAGASSWERFYTQTTSVSPSKVVNYAIPVGTFIGTVTATGRLSAVGSGSGTLGDWWSVQFSVQGSNVGGTVTLATAVVLLPVDPTSPASMSSNTLAVTSGAGELVFTATSTGQSALGNVDWQWDLKLLAN